MTTTDLDLTARAIVAGGKGILGADETPGTLTRRLAAVPGIVFLSGGQDHVTATHDLCQINQQRDSTPWTLTFSYGRALQDEALAAWGGRGDNVPAAQRAFYHRARGDAAAANGQYSYAMEAPSAAASPPLVAPAFRRAPGDLRRHSRVSAQRRQNRSMP
jgi:fructose-bisphosphate aldolase class 1